MRHGRRSALDELVPKKWRETAEPHAKLLSFPLHWNQQLPTMSEMYIIKRDGRKESVHFDKITSRISKLCYGLNPKVRLILFSSLEKYGRHM